MTKELDTLGDVIKTAYEAEADTNAYDDAAVSKLSGIEAEATADQTGAEIKSAYEAEDDTNAYDDAAVSKLGGIEAGAQVNVAPEGTAVLSTGEVGGTKFLREDGDGTCSWQAASGGSGAFEADVDTQITPTTPIVLDEATGDEVALDLPLTVNKASSGDAYGVRVNVTHTASPDGIYYLDLQKGGSSIFNVVDAFDLGRTGINVNTYTYISRTSSAGFIAFGYGDFTDPDFAVKKERVTLASNGYYAFANSADAANGTEDTKLYRDAANTLALRNSTNAQTFNVYNTYTDASNYERIAISGTTIDTEAAGTGTKSHLNLGSSTTQVVFPAANTKATPAITFSGDTDTGFFHNEANRIHVAIDGNDYAQFGGGWTFASRASGAPGLLESTASATVATLLPSVGDTDTGIGRAAADQLSLIAGGVEGIRISEDTTITIDMNGAVLMPDLPTSDPSVAGQLYSSSGTLMVSAG